MRRLRTLLSLKTRVAAADSIVLPLFSIGGAMSRPPGQTDLLIAVLDPEIQSPRWHSTLNGPQLRLNFADTWPGRVGHGQHPATTGHLETAWAFVSNHGWGTLEGPHLHLHCQAGHSRSPAVALYLLRRLLGPGSERVSLEGLLQIRPGAAPNIWVLQLADQALGSRLVQTARKAGHLSGDGWT